MWVRARARTCAHLRARARTINIFEKQHIWNERFWGARICAHSLIFEVRAPIYSHFSSFFSIKYFFHEREYMTKLVTLKSKVFQCTAHVALWESEISQLASFIFIVFLNEFLNECKEFSTFHFLFEIAFLLGSEVIQTFEGHAFQLISVAAQVGRFLFRDSMETKPESLFPAFDDGKPQKLDVWKCSTGSMSW